MSQEFPENTADYFEEPMNEQVEEQVEEAVEASEPVAPANQALIYELQQERFANRQAREELHFLRTATLQQASYANQGVDPIESAMSRIKKAADPDAFKFVEPMLRPVVEELLNSRRSNEELFKRNQQLENGLNFIAQKDRERDSHSQLAQAIPDLPTIGPRILEIVGRMPAEMQAKYAADPSLLLPIAELVRGTSGKGGSNARAAQAKVAMDIGGSSSGATSFNTGDVSSMRPGSKEFEAERSRFWGSD